MNTYSWLGLDITVGKACCLADISEGQLDDIVLGIVVRHVTIPTKQIRAGNLSIIIEDFFSLLNGFDSFHDQTLLFLEETSLWRN
jgi:hypothetical protein